MDEKLNMFQNEIRTNISESINKTLSKTITKDEIITIINLTADNFSKKFNIDLKYDCDFDDNLNSIMRPSNFKSGLFMCDVSIEDIKNMTDDCVTYENNEGVYTWAENVFSFTAKNELETSHTS